MHSSPLFSDCPKNQASVVLKDGWSQVRVSVLYIYIYVKCEEKYFHYKTVLKEGLSLIKDSIVEHCPFIAEDINWCSLFAGCCCCCSLPLSLSLPSHIVTPMRLGRWPEFNKTLPLSLSPFFSCVNILRIVIVSSLYVLPCVVFLLWTDDKVILTVSWQQMLCEHKAGSLNQLLHFEIYGKNTLVFKRVKSSMYITHPNT